MTALYAEHRAAKQTHATFKEPAPSCAFWARSGLKKT